MMNSGAELFPVLSSLDFDVGIGVELCGNDAEFYCELIRELYTDVLARRHVALQSNVLQVRRDYAHLLKGTLQVLGERKASAKARDLEQALRGGLPHDELTMGLAADLDRIAGALRNVFDGLAR